MIIRQKIESQSDLPRFYLIQLSSKYPTIMGYMLADREVSSTFVDNPNIMWFYGRYRKYNKRT